MLDKDAIAELLRRVDAKVILLSRLNVMKMIVSWFNSERLYEATGDWNQYPPGVAPEPLRDRFGEVRSATGAGAAWQSAPRGVCASLKLPKMQVCYEDLLTNRAANSRSGL